MILKNTQYFLEIFLYLILQEDLLSAAKAGERKTPREHHKNRRINIYGNG